MKMRSILKSRRGSVIPIAAFTIAILIAPEFAYADTFEPGADEPGVSTSSPPPAESPSGDRGSVEQPDSDQSMQPRQRSSTAPKETEEAAPKTAVSVTIKVTNPKIRTYPDGTPGTVSGSVTTDSGPAGYVTMRIERQLTGGAWQDIGSIHSWSDGSWSLPVESSSAQLINYRLRSVATDNWQSALSDVIVQEARHDPLDSKQVTNLTAAARNSGLSISLGFVDRITGRTYAYNTANAEYFSASVAKVMIAMEALRYDMDAGLSTPSPANVTEIRKMIRQSANEPAWAYWNKYGGTAVYDRINRRCDVTMPMAPNGWGRSQPSPLQVSQVLDCLADYRALNAGLSEWLLLEMRSVTSSQRWGIPAAKPDPFRTEGNKNGWSTWSTVTFRTVNSVASFGPGNRYTLSVFTQYPATQPDSVGHAAIKSVTQAMFPAGTIIY